MEEKMKDWLDCDENGSIIKPFLPSNFRQMTTYEQIDFFKELLKNTYDLAPYTLHRIQFYAKEIKAASSILNKQDEVKLAEELIKEADEKEKEIEVKTKDILGNLHDKIQAHNDKIREQNEKK